FADELQRILDDAVLATNGVGVTAAVVAEGDEPWTGAAGNSVRSATATIPMTPDMLFEVGSVAKTFVTTLLMQLVDRGVVSLDDPLSRWISGYPQLDPRISLRDLVDSTSGIPEWVDHPSSPFKRGVDKSRAWLARSWTVDDMLTELVGKPEFPPGTRWQYSTTGFRLVREVLERQTGKPIAELIQTRLLDPLGIHGMWLTPTWPIPKGIPIAHEWYDLDGDTSYDDITDIPKTGFADLKSAPVYSNALDLARFCQGLFHGGTLLSDSSLAAMLDFRPVADPAEPVLAEYGLGVGVFHLPNLAGLEHYGHGGHGFGYVAMMLYLPRHNASVVVLVNDGVTMDAVVEPFLRAVDEGL
ncbi:MAG TPA: serine hydrolase domain-containing protein, partial [Gaiellaceae bacterium]|nr:serine hydrolase domain-containing protein [Gaiellaceae bacterium]